ncbi:MAG: hypothetical protein ACYSWP_11900 [Planctomycetota bacterium]
MDVNNEVSIYFLGPILFGFFGADFWGDFLYISRFVFEPMIFYSLYRVRDISHGLCNSFMDNLRHFAGTLHKEEHEEILIKQYSSKF